MKLLIWNIQHGGAARIARIVEEIAAHDPELIALTSTAPGPALLALRRVARPGMAAHRINEPDRERQRHRRVLADADAAH